MKYLQSKSVFEHLKEGGLMIQLIS